MDAIGPAPASRAVHPQAEVHPAALIAPGATVGPGCRIGPWCSIGPDVVLGAGVELMSHVVVDGHTTVGEGVRASPFVTIGLPPQDLKYRNEPTRCEVGARTQLREGATIHRASSGGHGVTRVGADCLIMATAHVAHDCTLGDRVILANNVMLGGHVQVGESTFIGGGAAVHQFVRIGRQAVIGGLAGIGGDLVPFGATVGVRTRRVGLNLVGLRRRGFPRPSIHALRAAFRLLFEGTTPFAERLAETESRYGADPLVAEVLTFMAEGSRRGTMRSGRSTGKDEEAGEAA